MKTKDTEERRQGERGRGEEWEENKRYGIKR